MNDFQSTLGKVPFLTQEDFLISFWSNFLSDILIALIVAFIINKFTDLFRKPNLKFVVKQGGIYKDKITISKNSEGDYEAVGVVFAIKNSGNQIIKAGEGYWHTYIKSEISNFSAAGESHHQRDVLRYNVYPQSFTDLEVSYNFLIKKEEEIRSIPYFFQTDYGMFPKTMKMNQTNGTVILNKMGQLQFEVQEN